MAAKHGKLEKQIMQVFINKCLQTIFNVYWPDKTTNEELMQKANENPLYHKEKEI